MNKLIKKFISLFLLVVFSLVSGPGQLIHAAFHDHTYTIESNTGATTLDTPHTICAALQLTLPEFFNSGTCVIQTIAISEDHFFAELETAIPHLFSIKNSDRAPPVLV
jgi:hypothetical protein